MVRRGKLESAVADIVHELARCRSALEKLEFRACQLVDGPENCYLDFRGGSAAPKRRTWANMLAAH